MTHFAALVIGDSIDEQMEFYNGNTESCKPELLKYHASDRKGKSLGYFSSKAEARATLKRRMCVGESWYTNPNAKYDYYGEGGRYTGFFKLKEGGEGTLGFINPFGPPRQDGYVDSCAVGDVDFDFMYAEAREKAEKTYAIFEEATTGRPIPKMNHVFQELYSNPSEAYEAFAAQPGIELLSEHGLLPWGSTFENEYGSSREVYVKRIVDEVCAPYVLVKDGQWYQNGENGWWDGVRLKMGKPIWNDKLQELFRTLPATTQLTILNCHA